MPRRKPPGVRRKRASTADDGHGRGRDRPGPGRRDPRECGRPWQRRYACADRARPARGSVAPALGTHCSATTGGTTTRRRTRGDTATMDLPWDGPAEVLRIVWDTCSRCTSSSWPKASSDWCDAGWRSPPPKRQAGSAQWRLSFRQQPGEPTGANALWLTGNSHQNVSAQCRKSPVRAQQFAPRCTGPAG